MERVQILVRGAVQGVGFRPHVYRLARQLGLSGSVRNSPAGVLIEAQGPAHRLDQLLLRLAAEAPPPAAIHGLEPRWLDAVHDDGDFTILASQDQDAPSALILPDIATCAACRHELFDVSNRRYRYPFLNCTHCGPRFSIIRALPYDRARTSMRAFRMCRRCRAEYDNPEDRRFHAQPNACSDCGPQLSWLDASGQLLARGEAALQAAEAAIEAGLTVAARGLGGFHLLADAGDSAAIARLRRRKHRAEKPLALMVPDVSMAERLCYLSALERRALTSPEAPIVLLQRRADAGFAISPAVAPEQSTFGLMLPYTPMHHLLLRDLGRPLVATSGNLSDEPICVTPAQARQRLTGIADGFLLHDRPILRPVDDSIVRVVLGREMVVRRSRGYAPLPLPLPAALPPTLAAGAQQKNTVALGRGTQAFLSQHIGDLGSVAAAAAWQRAGADLQQLYRLRAGTVVTDLHPDYDATRMARRQVRECNHRQISVQHHLAHVLSCMTENELCGPLLGVAWDGTGLGSDGSIWGGEFFHVDARGNGVRVGHLLPFRLAGGDTAAREPRYSAIAMLAARYGLQRLRRCDLPPLAAFTAAERRLLTSVLAGNSAPVTSSAGRLFDGLAALLDLRQVTRHEGHAPMLLEAAATVARDEGEYPMEVRATDDGVVLDWGPLVDGVLRDHAAAVDVGIIARRAHLGLAAGIVAMAVHLNHPVVVLSGGCFQNALLTSAAVAKLRQAGLQPYWHQRVPPNDGGIALGQLADAAWRRVRARSPIAEEEPCVWPFPVRSSRSTLATSS